MKLREETTSMRQKQRQRLLVLMGDCRFFGIIRKTEKEKKTEEMNRN
jgi:hypothetical protein